MEKAVEEMSEEAFQKHIQALAIRRLDKPKKLSAECAKHWGEIISQQYNFDRGESPSTVLFTLFSFDNQGQVLNEPHLSIFKYCYLFTYAYDVLVCPCEIRVTETYQYFGQFQRRAGCCLALQKLGLIKNNQQQYHTSLFQHSPECRNGL